MTLMDAKTTFIHVYGKGGETHHYNKGKSLALYRPVNMVVMIARAMMQMRTEINKL